MQCYSTKPLSAILSPLLTLLYPITRPPLVPDYFHIPSIPFSNSGHSSSLDQLGSNSCTITFIALTPTYPSWLECIRSSSESQVPTACCHSCHAKLSFTYSNIVSVDGRPFNTRTGRAPELIFVPSNSHEIVDIFREARKYNKLVSARGGGHSYAAYGLGGKDGTWVIDLQRFDKVDIDIHGEHAFVGAGNRLGRVALQLYDRAKKAIPHGLCPRYGTP